MRKFSSVGIVLVVIILGGWLLRNKGTEESLAPATPTQTVTEKGETANNLVFYTDQGYSPTALTVRVGTTVVFQNQSSGTPMWTASNIHPTHTILPEFDALTAAPPGESYSFTFSETGTWKYHNHLKPADGGTIIVE